MSEHTPRRHEGAESGFPQFEYSPENPPPLEILEEKIFAVHATTVLPKDGVMIAAARDTRDEGIGDEEPPSFRPTIHFALGEVVQTHGQFSWDDKPFAVVVPLKALKDQLINVYPNDTYILGNYQLGEDSTLVVPQGIDTNHIPDTVEIVTYDPDIGLRQAVNELVKEKEGWPIRMQPSGVDTGSIARIGDVDINDALFFSALYQERPHISYGTHCTSERGEAFRFGSIEQATLRVMDGYQPFGSQFTTAELQFYRAYISHNQTRLTESLQAQNLPPEAMNDFAQKVTKLQGWLNIIDVDLEIRQRFGKTLNRAHEPLLDPMRAKRHNMPELRQMARQSLDQLPIASDKQELPNPAILAEVMRAFDPVELEAFIGRRPHIFEGVDIPRLYANYAVRRWVLDKDEVARERGLDAMLEQALQQLEPTDIGRWDEPIFENLSVQLSTGSNRLGTALRILRQPYVREYLQRAYNITLAEGEPRDLESILRAHPETSILFNPPELELTTDQQLAAYKFLEDIEEIAEPTRDPADALGSFVVARTTSWEIKWIHNDTVENIETMSLPMNSARDEQDITVGERLNFYEMLRRDVAPLEVWRHVGLEESYRHYFPDDELFWQSDQSLLDIYQMLVAEEASFT